MRFKLIDRYQTRAAQISVLTIYSFLGSMLTIGFLVVIDFEYFVEFLSNIELAEEDQSIDIFFWVMAITVMPFVETLIFQFAFLKAVKNSTAFIFDSESWIPAFILTSISFAVFHIVLADSYYNAHWFILPRLPGSIAFAMIAITEFQREDGHPLLVTTIAHSCFNLFLLIVLGIASLVITLYSILVG